MARSAKSQPATSGPKTRKGQRQTSFEKTTIDWSPTAGEAPREQEQGESKARPGARDVKRPRATVRGRTRQHEKQGKVRSRAEETEQPMGQITKPKGRGKAKRRPRLGKSTRKGSRKSRSPSVRKNTRSRATAPALITAA